MADEAGEPGEVDEEMRKRRALDEVLACLAEHDPDDIRDILRAAASFYGIELLSTNDDVWLDLLGMLKRDPTDDESA